MKRHILFVDDEAKILEALKRMLRTMHNEWELHFATDGIAALEILARESMDLAYFDSVGKADRLSDWRAWCMDVSVKETVA
jgi:CheY-like chemotaxis protein